VARSSSRAWDLRIYGAMARVIGARAAGRIALLSDKVRT
jgi:hypothetical protein